MPLGCRTDFEAERLAGTVRAELFPRLSHTAPQRADLYPLPLPSPTMPLSTRKKTGTGPRPSRRSPVPKRPRPWDVGNEPSTQTSASKKLRRCSLPITLTDLPSDVIIRIFSILYTGETLFSGRGDYKEQRRNATSLSLCSVYLRLLYISLCWEQRMPPGLDAKSFPGGSRCTCRRDPKKCELPAKLPLSMMQHGVTCTIVQARQYELLRGGPELCVTALRRTLDTVRANNSSFRVRTLICTDMQGGGVKRFIFDSRRWLERLELYNPRWATLKFLRKAQASFLRVLHLPRLRRPLCHSAAKFICHGNFPNLDNIHVSVYDRRVWSGKTCELNLSFGTDIDKDRHKTPSEYMRRLAAKILDGRRQVSVTSMSVSFVENKPGTVCEETGPSAHRALCGKLWDITVHATIQFIYSSISNFSDSFQDHHRRLSIITSLSRLLPPSSSELYFKQFYASGVVCGGAVRPTRLSLHTLFQTYGNSVLMPNNRQHANASLDAQGTLKLDRLRTIDITDVKWKEPSDSDFQFQWSQALGRFASFAERCTELNVNAHNYRRDCESTRLLFTMLQRIRPPIETCNMSTSFMCWLTRNHLMRKFVYRNLAKCKQFQLEDLLLSVEGVEAMPGLDVDAEAILGHLSAETFVQCLPSFLDNLRLSSLLLGEGLRRVISVHALPDALEHLKESNHVRYPASYANNMRRCWRAFFELRTLVNDICADGLYEVLRVLDVQLSTAITATQKAEHQKGIADEDPVTPAARTPTTGGGGLHNVQENAVAGNADNNVGAQGGNPPPPPLPPDTDSEGVDDGINDMDALDDELENINRPLDNSSDSDAEIGHMGDVPEGAAPNNGGPPNVDGNMVQLEGEPGAGVIDENHAIVEHVELMGPVPEDVPNNGGPPNVDADMAHLEVEGGAEVNENHGNIEPDGNGN